LQPSYPTLNFLLVPDAGAARRIRRLLVEKHARGGLVVGSWPELLEWARRTYLLPEPGDDWDAIFRAALDDVEGAFWKDSLSVAPAETMEAVLSALVQVISATDPERGLTDEIPNDFPDRPRRHLSDLRRLTKTLKDRLPPDLATLRAVLAAQPADALQHMRVHFLEGAPHLDRWQQSLVDKLNRDAGADDADPADPADPDMRAALNQVLSHANQKQPATALGILQSKLYTSARHDASLDGSAQWLGVRDFLQEAEVAAGIVQQMLAAHPELEPADIGLLIPDSFEYAVAVEDAFRLGGLALSGLPAERWRRDLGHEAVFHFLYCRQKPAPAMALAVCLSSPLMPWSRKVGARLAQAVMEGDYKLAPLDSASAPARKMLDLLRIGDTRPETLAIALQEFTALLVDEDLHGTHVHRARSAAASLCARLYASQDIDWLELRRAVTPRFIRAEEATPDFNREGVTVWRESQEPWRGVRRLVVLGFARGAYPSSHRQSAVFSAEDLAVIRERTGLVLDTPAEVLARKRQQFVRQLRAASESVTFLIPRRDAMGANQPPSESLVFMSQLFAGPESAQELIKELDSPEGRAQAAYLSLAPPAAPQPPRALLAKDLEFGRDLLALRTDAAGNPKPQSPSSLETLMVSRLAWLLRHLDAEPLAWAPESSNPMLLGSVAHHVLECLFAPGRPLPDETQIRDSIETHIDEAVRQMAPFLRGALWQVEMRHFKELTTRAALAWRTVLNHLDAEVLACEAWLQGSWAGVPIHGQTDLILGLPGGRLLVVDYKRSKHAKRLAQMKNGYDCQAHLYRTMLQTGGLKHGDDAALAARLRSAAAPGVVYFMLNDQVALSDALLPGCGAIPGWHVLDNDVAEHAMALIGRRLEEVRSGRLTLNRADDQAFFEKVAGLTPYALEKSPLIALFTLDGEAEVWS
jgi:ATP-dependent helicase/nuclease subunit B